MREPSWAGRPARRTAHVCAQKLFLPPKPSSRAQKGPHNISAPKRWHSCHSALRSMPKAQQTTSRHCLKIRYCNQVPSISEKQALHASVFSHVARRIFSCPSKQVIHCKKKTFRGLSFPFSSDTDSMKCGVQHYVVFVRLRLLGLMWQRNLSVVSSTASTNFLESSDRTSGQRAAAVLADTHHQGYWSSIVFQNRFRKFFITAN